MRCLMFCLILFFVKISTSEELSCFNNLDGVANSEDLNKACLKLHYLSGCDEAYYTNINLQKLNEDTVHLCLSNGSVIEYVIYSRSQKNDSLFYHMGWRSQPQTSGNLFISNKEIRGNFRDGKTNNYFNIISIDNEKQLLINATNAQLDTVAFPPRLKKL